MFSWMNLIDNEGLEKYSLGFLSKENLFFFFVFHIAKKPKIIIQASKITNFCIKIILRLHPPLLGICLSISIQSHFL